MLEEMHSLLQLLWQAAAGCKDQKDCGAWKALSVMKLRLQVLAQNTACTQCAPTGAAPPLTTYSHAGACQGVVSSAVVPHTKLHLVFPALLEVGEHVKRGRPLQTAVLVVPRQPRACKCRVWSLGV